MKTRVAIVLPYFGNGGAENMVSRLVSHLNLDKVEAEVICIFSTPQKNQLENNIIAHGVPIKFVRKEKGFSIRAIKRLNAELSDFHPDIIHTHLSACVYCAEWVLTHRIKMLHTIHNMPAYELIKSKQIVMSVLYNLRKAVPVTISHEIQYLTQKYYHLKEKPELIYNPVDVKKYAIVKKVKSDNVVLVNVGRLSQQKNQMLLIQAFEKILKEYKTSQLYILGDGPLHRELEQYIMNHKLTSYIHLEGNVNNVEQYFAKADIFVLSSNYEGLPLVILEAMAACLPIVSTDVGGVKDIVTNNGILVESNNLDELVGAIKRMIENMELRKQLGEYSFANVQQFDSAVIAEQYTDLYKKYSNR